MIRYFYLIGILLFAAISISYSQTIYIPSNAQTCESQCIDVTQDYLNYINCPFSNCNYCAVGPNWNDSGGWGRACGEIEPQTTATAKWSIFRYQIFECRQPCNQNNKFYKFTFTTSTCSLGDKYDPDFPGFLRIASPSCQENSVGYLYKVCCNGNRVGTTVSLGNIDNKNPEEGTCGVGLPVIRYVEESIAQSGQKDIYCQNINYTGSLSLTPQQPQATSTLDIISNIASQIKPFIIYKFSNVNIRVTASSNPLERFWLEIKDPKNNIKVSSPFLYYPRYSSLQLQCFYPRAGTHSLVTYVDEIRNDGKIYKKGSTPFDKQVYRYICYQGFCWECPQEPQISDGRIDVRSANCQVVEPAKCQYYIRSSCQARGRE